MAGCAVESVGAPLVSARRGDVSVSLSAWNARAIANAVFLDDAGGCTVRESVPCRERTCSLSAGTLHIQGTAPALALDVEDRDRRSGRGTL
jgi:hypothetical protein